MSVGARPIVELGTMKLPVVSGSNWPVVRLRDPARELTSAASASSANLRIG